MTNDNKPRRWRWVGRIAGGLALLLVALVVAGAAYQAIAEAQDRAAFPPPGQLVDIGGFRLHILCEGEPRPGRATVILESGLGTATPAWTRVQSEVARTTRVCAYDRAGIGWSETSPNPRDPAHIAQELHALLRAAHIATPIVLVGHSSGGLYVRAYQRLYPQDVSGLVLLEPTPEGFGNLSARTRGERLSLRRTLTVTPALAAIGIIRLLPACRQGFPPDFPRLQAAQFTALCAATKSWSVQLEEHLRLVDPLPPAVPLTIPLALFTAGANVVSNPDWGRMHNQIAALSPNSLHRVFPKAQHSSFLIDKHYAHESALVIEKVVTAAETNTPLR